VKLSLSHNGKNIENIVAKKVFGPKRKKMARGWRKPRSEELYNLHASHNNLRAIK